MTKAMMGVRGTAATPTCFFTKPKMMAFVLFFIVCYFTTMSVARLRNIEWRTSDELEKIWKDAVVVK
jgi:hypothetical protein